MLAPLSRRETGGALSSSLGCDPKVTSPYREVPAVIGSLAVAVLS